MDAAFLEDMWRVNALAGFFFAKAALEAMLPRERGVLIFTGASRRSAAARTSAASPRPRRRCARSRSRPRASSGPQGIHVAHVVVDGAIDGDRINTFLPGLKAERGPDGLLDPDAIAENYLDALPPAAQRLDPRARRAALGRDLVGKRSAHRGEIRGGRARSLGPPRDVWL